MPISSSVAFTPEAPHVQSRMLAGNLDGALTQIEEDQTAAFELTLRKTLL
jgi:hypothetical protein